VILHWILKAAGGKVQSVFFDDRNGASSRANVVHNASTQPLITCGPPHAPLMMHRTKSTEQLMEVVRMADLADLKSQREIFST